MKFIRKLLSLFKKSNIIDMVETKKDYWEAKQ